MHRPGADLDELACRKGSYKAAGGSGPQQSLKLDRAGTVSRDDNNRQGREELDDFPN
ncbi:hypothetical protein SBV1_3380005 [Verrucomicrobia bacterium]|nr:hypothetical protein SBV1_3380005 [Verrucomicrobiota bacterium]